MVELELGLVMELGKFVCPRTFLQMIFVDVEGRESNPANLRSNKSKMLLYSALEKGYRDNQNSQKGWTSSISNLQVSIFNL